MWYSKVSFTIFGMAIAFLFSGCSSIFFGDSSEIRKHSESTKPSPDSDIPQAKAHPYAYSGTLKRCDSFWIPSFWKPNYDYCITDSKGDTIAFLDVSNLAIGTSLANLIGKTVTVSGQTFPHKYRGIIVVKVKHIIATTN
ncbi:MAG: hypothetical protein LBF34_04670 [Puniceicoccales bacterium]|nr:hypothetical protein [Puniceicoccales bacterium]